MGLLLVVYARALDTALPLEAQIVESINEAQIVESIDKPQIVESIDEPPIMENTDKAHKQIGTAILCFSVDTYHIAYNKSNFIIISFYKCGSDYSSYDMVIPISHIFRDSLISSFIALMVGWAIFLCLSPFIGYVLYRIVGKITQSIKDRHTYTYEPVHP